MSVPKKVLRKTSQGMLPVYMLGRLGGQLGAALLDLAAEDLELSLHDGAELGPLAARHAGHEVTCCSAATARACAHDAARSRRRWPAP